ncbi:ABC transporter (iron.B12.siderophore.hemin), permease component [Actinokineospora spheciospongiae]|uniref:ABC transporter (Iron.B12.siderophore.hemin), permease component n=1 Tax=Actinokineospora spheciospongiae TaxID=909613 RepID=W7IWR5_9PSEU|nr:iron ABC transporter permease [Actinokineospora spheciospongiae]EWC60906.1 ABC transporter (iron.B12.siderophore.hemin), permease component [Actinokineospora spheciospongiae]PWW60333.1 iron complex transport system permease protein [Actinokineospora spheciospongiae]
MPTLPLVLALSVCLVLSMAVSLTLGSESLRPAGVWRAVEAGLTGTPGPDRVYDAIVWDLRAPRVVLAAVVGAGLAVAGAVVQTLVRNPLADPYLLGVSAGAGVGATLVIVAGAFGGLGVWGLSAGALAGAVVAALLVFGVALAQGGLTPLRLVLTGVVLSAAFSSVSSFLVFVGDEPEATQAVLHWLLGSLSGATWDNTGPALVAVAVATAALVGVHSWLDALASGPDVAAALGVPVRGVRIGLFLLSSVLVGVLVAVSGGVGFVGLVVPHLARVAVGARHAAVLPVAAVGGALFLVWVDVVARVLVRPQEMPLSVVTGLIGAPVFLVLMGRRHYSFSGGGR